MSGKALAPVCGLLLALTVPSSRTGAAAAATPADAAALRQKVASIVTFAEGERRGSTRTTITENELNAFLTYDAADFLPLGVVEPTVSILGTGRVSGKAVVDLDAVRQSRNRGREGGLFDPLSYAGGRLPVTATGVLEATDGIGRFTLESATLAGIPIPKPLLQEIVTYYSRTPESPNGFDMDGPFDLPASIREIQVEPGRAVIVQ